MCVSNMKIEHAITHESIHFFPLAIKGNCMYT